MLPSTPRAVFICYAHADNKSDDPKRRWLDRFLTFLQPFVRQEDFTVCSDQDVQTGGVLIRDLNATILHLLGFDHETLTYPFHGLDQRLTGVEHARVVNEILV